MTNGSTEDVGMQGTQPPRFSPTLWPSESRQLPPVAVWDAPYARERRQVGLVELPEDFVLQEVLDVTAENFDEFSAQWGSLATSAGGDRSQGLLGVTLLQAMSRHYLADVERGGDAVVDAWPIDPAPESASDAWRLWEHHMNDALRAFTLYVRVDPAEPTTGDRLADIQARTTYQVAALQLAQIATEGRTVRRCASETCGKPFTAQRSRRRQYAGTAHAEGVKYCRHECAKAQSERERRRRRRAESS